MTSTRIALALAAALANRDTASATALSTPDFRTHSTFAPDPGTNAAPGLGALVAALPAGFGYRPTLVLTDVHHIALFATCTGLGPTALCSVDLFRLRNGRVAEHWDALNPHGVPPAGPASLRPYGPPLPGDIARSRARTVLLHLHDPKTPHQLGISENTAARLGMDPVEAPPGSRRVEAVLIDSDHVLAHTTTGGAAAGSAFHLYRFDNPYKPTAILTVAGAPVPTSAAPAGPPTPPAPRQR